ncbi:hypothetical protein [Streptomyces lydicus]|uniref:hypothetical protein n=1 Tax=Streptomyces lydicus TaxID=47763 RepID=UPI0037D3DF58
MAAAIAESLYFVLSKPLLTRYSSMELNLYVTIPGTLMMLPFAGDLTHQLASATTPQQPSSTTAAQEPPGAETCFACAGFQIRRVGLGAAAGQASGPRAPRGPVE